MWRMHLCLNVELSCRVGGASYFVVLISFVATGRPEPFFEAPVEELVGGLVEFLIPSESCVTQQFNPELVTTPQIVF